MTLNKRYEKCTLCMSWIQVYICISFCYCVTVPVMIHLCRYPTAEGFNVPATEAQ